MKTNYCINKEDKAMNHWIKYEDADISSKDHAVNIISTLGRCRNIFFSFPNRPIRTRLIKKELVKLGHSFGFKVYANGLSETDLSEIDAPFVNREWVFDLHWYSEGSEPYSINQLPLVVECEWNPKRKRDRKVLYSGMKYDFQKLVIANADLRLMIFKLISTNDLVHLDTYFNNIISNYRHLGDSDKFLLLAYYDKTNTLFYNILTKADALTRLIEDN